MAMPEATMHKHCHAEGREHDIGPAGQIAPMEPETEPRAMKSTADMHLWLRVAPTNA